MGKIIAITGGIGVGKSIVSTILRHLGYYVYDCDSEAKNLMDHNQTIHKKLIDLIHPQAVIDGKINREIISSVVFNDSEKLSALNGIVHQAVASHLNSWIYDKQYRVLFFETAILYQSKFDLLCDSVWEVTAPVDIRIKRVMKRNCCSKESVIQRIKSQENYNCDRNKKPTFRILNDNLSPILPQINKLLHSLC